MFLYQKPQLRHHLWISRPGFGFSLLRKCSPSLEIQERGVFTAYNINYSNEAVILTLIFISFTIFTTYFTVSHNIIN